MSIYIYTCSNIHVYTNIFVFTQIYLQLYEYSLNLPNLFILEIYSFIIEIYFQIYEYFNSYKCQRH